MGGNYFAKLIYFIALIVLALLLIPSFSYYKLAWLIIYLLLGIICFSSAFTLTLFFVINIIIGLIFYVKSGNFIYLEMLLVLILGFVASTANIKKKHHRGTSRLPKVPKAELIKKELSSSTTEAPKVEVYGKFARKSKKTAKKKTTKKTKRKAGKKTKKSRKKKTKKKKSKKRR